MKRSLTDYPLAGKRVLVRVDFNVPLEDGRVADDTRIRAALPTITYLLDQGCAVVLASHLGRPKGQVVDGLRMAPVAARLSELLGRPVATADDCVGPRSRRRRPALRPGEVLLLENLRFHAEETGNDAEFARQLAGARRRLRERRLRHRAPRARLDRGRHALPAVRGRAAHDPELEVLGRLLRDPARPFVVVLGGLKVSDKISAHPATCSAWPTRSSSAAPWPTRSSPPRATRSARRRAPATRSRSPPRSSPRPASARGELLLPTDVVVRDERRTAGAPARVAPADGIAAGRDGARHRPADHRRVRAPAARRRAPSTGTARWASSRSPSSPPARRPSARPSPPAPP